MNKDKTFPVKNGKCPNGYIIREGHKKIKPKSNEKINIKPRCIKNRGLPGKYSDRNPGEKGIGPLNKGGLSKYGYVNVKNMKSEERHNALKKAVKDIPPLTLWRKLNAIYVYNKNTNKTTAQKFKADRNWIHRMYIK